MVYYLFVVSYYSWFIYIVDDTLNSNVKLLNISQKVKEYTVVKSGNKVLILIQLPSQYSNNWYQRRSFKKQFNHQKEIMEYAKIGAPSFDGQNYSFWSKMMQTFLHA
jgi:hypothetical protein